MSKRYPFGKNWQRFLEKTLTEERIEIARKRLLESLRLTDLHGMSFLDIGCGSGMHSLAAFQSGAEKVLSLDYDRNSVEATRFLHGRSGSPAHWTVMQGDVLDRARIDSLGRWDLVYSWGVLHHTGDVWRALRHASVPLADDGVLLVALYTTDVCPDPEETLELKQRYNRATPSGQRIMEARFVWKQLVLPNLRRLRPWVPVKHIIDYRRHRGMSYYTDVRDWLGGWPMEFAGVRETRNFAEHELGLELLACYGGAANTEYVWCREGAACYWRRMEDTAGPVALQKPFMPAGGNAYSAALPPWPPSSPGESSLRAYRLSEDGRTLGPNCADSRQIRLFGAGAFNVVEGRVLFSASDSSDPNENGRLYELARTGSATR